MHTDTVQLEIRAAEGGMDAKLFVNDLFSMYKKFCARHGWTIKETARFSGEVHARVIGENAYS